MSRALRSALYTGHLAHARWEPKRHQFRYPVYWLLLDVDELPELDARLRLFSHNRGNLLSVSDRDYIGADGPGLRAAVEEQARAAGVTEPLARIELLTNARVLGYLFNPVSFFSAYAADGRALLRIAEINNTYGEWYRYVLDDGCRVPSVRGEEAYERDKAFYVSPYIEMEGRYRFAFSSGFDERGRETREVRMDEERQGRRFFHARWNGVRRPLGDAALAGALLRYPLMTLQVIGLIHWEALRLYLKGVPRVPHVPTPAHARPGARHA